MYSEKIFNLDTSLVIKAIKKFTGLGALSVDPVNMEIHPPMGVDIKDVKMPTEEELLSIIDDVASVEKFDNFESELALQYSRLTKLIKNTLVGKDTSPEQLEEYDKVTTAVLTNDLDYFKVDAEILHTSVQIEFEKAKKIVDKYIVDLKEGEQLLRAIRRFISKESKSKIDRSISMVEKMKTVTEYSVVNYKQIMVV